MGARAHRRTARAVALAAGLLGPLAVLAGAPSAGGPAERGLPAAAGADRSATAAPAIASASQATALGAALAEGAAMAQARCQKLIHHDTFVFDRCLGDLLAGESKPSARRLGIEYFGFAGAMNSARMGMLGAQQSAWVFLQRYRKTQRRLRVDDATVCASVPGDCAARIAQANAVQAAGRPPVAVEPLDGEHRP